MQSLFNKIIALIQWYVLVHYIILLTDWTTWIIVSFKSGAKELGIIILDCVSTCDEGAIAFQFFGSIWGDIC